MSAPARLPFAWWNTRLAPPSRESTATAEHRSAVREVVGHLIQQRGCRIVALAEVRQQSVLHLIPEEARETWDELRDLSGDRHDFDVAIGFDRARLTLIEHRWVRGSHAGQRVRAGLVATFCTEDESDWLIVVAAH